MTDLTLGYLALGAPPAETIDAAADAGFPAVGLRICARRPDEPYPVRVLGQPQAARALRERARDRGVRISNVSAYQFYPDVGFEALAPAIDATAELGAPFIVVNGFDDDLARFDDRFGRYCAAAAAVGVRVALEFLPYGGVRTLGDALAAIDRVGAANAGVLIDPLHLDRSGGTPADVAQVDPRRIAFVQLSDAPPRTPGATVDELRVAARTSRLPAGTGSLPLYELLDVLDPALEIEYEVYRADLADASPAAKARAARADADRFMAAWRDRSRGRAR